MFRRLLLSGKTLSCVGGSAAATAAVVALSDKELGKKPEWYKNAVLDLEASIKKLGKYQPIESLEILDKAEDLFTRVSDYNSAEIQWRLGRALLEKSTLIHDAHEKEHLIHKAHEHLHKALALEPSGGCAGCHKWYAVALMKDSKAGKVHGEVVHHLEKAVKIDPKDPFSWHYLGVAHFNNKNYVDAVGALQKAEEARPGFSSANLFYLGSAQLQNGKKEEAIELLKKSLQLPSRNDTDGRAKLRAKDLLLGKLKLKWEDIDPTEDY